MAEQRITLTIDEQGAITAKTQGFKGQACLEALDALLDLEDNVTSLKKTDEFHQQVTAQSKTTLSQRGR
tara:strand:+ start:30409 stop:30615 length:207 start_codon:yes stop_codon:yes gene_type:complete